MTDSSLAARAVADDLLASKGRSFHWARRLLGACHADRATRLYGFCRRVDDLADETATPAAAMQCLSDLASALRQGTSDDPLTIDAITLFRELPIDFCIPLELIAGVASDLGRVRVANLAELLRYCYRVAGTVGLMMNAALDVTDRRGRAHAIDLGIAMQLTNLCRDVREDALADRRYLPASLVGDMEPDQLVLPSAGDRKIICAAIGQLLDLADQYYISGEDGLVYLPRDARASIAVAARVYRAIGLKLRSRGCDYWTSRVVVSRTQKISASTGALLALGYHTSRRLPARTHSLDLHAPLAGLPGVELEADALHGA